MHIVFVEIANFRKLKRVRIDFDKEKTLFVGANNSVRGSGAAGSGAGHGIPGSGAGSRDPVPDTGKEDSTGRYGLVA